MSLEFWKCLAFLVISWQGVCGYSGDNNTTYNSGPFTILYSPKTLPVLQVTYQNKLVWFTSSTQSPFISLEKVTTKVTQIGGDFTLDRLVTETCSELEIKEVGVRPPTYALFYINAVLCGDVAVEMTLQGFTVSEDHYWHLVMEVTMASNSKYNQVVLAYGCEKGEGFYGFGAQYSSFNMKGHVLPMFLSEQGVGRGLQPVTTLLDAVSKGAGGTWYTTYTRVPHYITSEQRSFFLESLEYAVFDLTTEDTVFLSLESSHLKARIIPGSSPLDLIRSFTALVGRLPPLPAWVGQGAVLGLQGGTASVLHTLDVVEQTWGNLSDVVGVWLQDWTGQRNFSAANDLPRVGLWWNWEVDETHYPGWTQFVANLRSKGIRTLTYINPLFSNVTQRGTPFHHNYYEEGLTKGYFVRHGEGGEVWTGYSNSTLLDISNPQAYQWTLNMIVENMLAPGVCGWMCDFGESLPLDALPTKQQANHTPSQLHSLYPSLWGQLNAEAIKKAHEKYRDDKACPQDEVVYFMRSGNAYSPANTRLFWLGDQMVTWDKFDGLATVVMGTLSQGLSGYSLSHSDIGGYTALYKPPVLKYLRSKELFLRWCELAAFSTMYRSHLGTLPNKNWQLDSDQDTLRHFFRMAVVFQSWGFYRNKLMQEGAEYGWPVARHMMLHFPANPRVYQEELTQQFMLGESLLVAPVLGAGQSSVSVFLPTGTTWSLIWGPASDVYRGDDSYHTFPAPLGQPCVLYNTKTTVGQQFIDNLKARKIL